MIFLKQTSLLAAILLSILPIFATAENIYQGTRTGRVLVVANKKSKVSCELALEYMRSRNLPPQNLLYLEFDNTINIHPSVVDEKLVTPVIKKWNKLGPAVDYAVLMRDIPYRTGKQSTTSAIMFGSVDDIQKTQGYYKSQRRHEAVIPCRGLILRPTTIISGLNVQEGLSLINRSRVSYPYPESAGTFYLCNGAGARGVRNRFISKSIKALKEAGYQAEHIKKVNIYGKDDVLGQFTGYTRLDMTRSTYMPGAVVDNLTSYGGYLLDARNQMSILSFVRYGACGAYGTVSEPTNRFSRWCTYDFPLLYAEGFNLPESYLQTVRDHSLGVVVGDPLLEPFSRPAALKLDHKKSIEKGGNLELNLKISSDPQNNKLSWIELWLDDRKLLFSGEPNIPAGSEITLKVHAQKKEFLTKSVTIDKQLPLRACLKKLNNITEEGIQTVQCGKRMNKLLVRRTHTRKSPKKIQSTLTIQNGDTVDESTIESHVTSLGLRGADYEFGNIPPHAGDMITFKMGEIELVEITQPGDLPKWVLERLVKKIQKIKPFAPEKGMYEIALNRIRKRDGLDAYNLVIISKTLAVPPKPPFSVTLERAPDSRYAPDFKEITKWQIIHAGRVTEAILQPGWPMGEKIEHKMNLPTADLFPGVHTLTLIAGTSNGAEAMESTEFLISESFETPSVSLQETVLDMSDSLILSIDDAGLADEYYPMLFVDDTPVCAWRQNSESGKLSLSRTNFAPGKHTLHIEWVDSPKLPSVDSPHTPKAAAAGIDFFIKRPVTDRAKFTPKSIHAGKNASIDIEGPYLRDNLTAYIGDQPVELKRQKIYGRKWTANVSHLQPGTYKVRLYGNKRIETSGSISGKLTITEPPEEKDEPEK